MSSRSVLQDSVARLTEQGDMIDANTETNRGAV